MDNNAPARNVDGTLKDASDIEWHYSETDEAPMSKKATPAPPPDAHGSLSDEELVAPRGVVPSVPRRARDLPDPALIVDGSHYRRPAARVREGRSEKPGDGLRRNINEFFHPKSSKCVVQAYFVFLTIILTRYMLLTSLALPSRKRSA